RGDDVVFLVRRQEDPGVRQRVLEAVILAGDGTVHETQPKKQVAKGGQSCAVHGQPLLSAMALSRIAASWRTAAGVSTWLTGMWTVIEAPARKRLNPYLIREVILNVQPVRHIILCIIHHENNR